MLLLPAAVQQEAEGAELFCAAATATSTEPKVLLQTLLRIFFVHFHAERGLANDVIKKSRFQEGVVCGACLNSAHTEFSSEQECVVFSAHLTADGHSLKQLSAAYFFFAVVLFQFCASLRSWS